MAWYLRLKSIKENFDFPLIRFGFSIDMEIMSVGFGQVLAAQVAIFQLLIGTVCMGDRQREILYIRFLRGVAGFKSGNMRNDI
jgi:hypothetical protein